MKSKFEGGRCPFCKGTIHKGQEIKNVKGKWGHANCDEVFVPSASSTSDDMPLTFTTAPFKFIPSIFQQAVYDTILNSNRNIVVRAVAGSGKTTTLEGMMNVVAQWCIQRGLKPADVRVVFVAFNKRIQLELAARLPKWVKVQTLHSFGLSIIRKHFPKVRIEDDKRRGEKINTIIDQFADFRLTPDLGEDDPNLIRRAALLDLVGKVKNTLTDYNDRQAVTDLAAYFGIDLNDSAELILDTLPKVLNECKKNTSLIDFDDMIWLPAILNLAIDPVDFLFVDEAQDLNAAQANMIFRACPAGRIVAVGDENQSIYGFRGADANALPKLTASINAVSLPLSICYRSARRIVELAKTIVPHIEARPDAPEGVIEYVNDETFASNVGQGDLVICRVNAPLIPYCYTLLRKGVKAVVYGRDVSRSIKGLAKKTFANDFNAMFAKIDHWLDKELAKLNAKHVSETAINAVIDRAETLKNILAECKETSDIYDQIEKIFSDDVAAVTLSSVHKAKGLEADRVWILKPQLLPLVRNGQQEWEKVQEKNIEYVAYTRAKNELYFVMEDEK